MAIDELKNHILEKAEKDAQELIRRANLVRDRELSQAKKRLEEWLSEAAKEFMKEKIALVSTYKSRTFKEISLEKTKLYDELWNDFLIELKNRLKQLSTNERYRSTILAIVIKTLSDVPDVLEVFVKADDISIFDNLKDSRIKVSEADIMGGLLLKPHGQNVVLNYSFDEILKIKEPALKSIFIEAITAN